MSFKGWAEDNQLGCNTPQPNLDSSDFAERGLCAEHQPQGVDRWKAGRKGRILAKCRRNFSTGDVHATSGQMFMTATAENWPRELGRELQRWEVVFGSLTVA